MGILKILAFSAAGIWSLRAISRLNVAVKHVAASPRSSLVRQAVQQGDFYADSFVVELPQRIVYSQVPVTISQVASSFFSCPVFSSVEKPLLKVL